MKIATRPLLAALFAAVVALAGCPEKPPQPRTAVPAARSGTAVPTAPPAGSPAQAAGLAGGRRVVAELTVAAARNT